MKYSILIAEDDVNIVELLSLYLKDQYHVFTANDGLEALEILRKTNIDIALVDIMMPKMNGYELIEKIREENNMPIIIVSAKTMDSDKIYGLNLGADAYLTKPFNPQEVVAYINATLRRYYKLGANDSIDRSAILRVGELELDTQDCILKKKGRYIPLTSAEYKLLVLMMRNPGKIYTKRQLYECLTGDKYLNDDNTVMVHISNMRGKIEDNPSKPQYIRTLRGIGYKVENIPPKE